MTCDFGRYVTVCRITDASVEACFADELTVAEKRRQRVAEKVQRRAIRAAMYQARRDAREAQRAKYLEIQRTYKAGGVTMQALGNRYGLTRQRIEQIINRPSTARNRGVSHG